MNQDLFNILKHSFKQTFVPAMLVALMMLVLDAMIYPSKYFSYSI